MSDEEEIESPYCSKCGGCGNSGCCIGCHECGYHQLRLRIEVLEEELENLIMIVAKISNYLTKSNENG